MNSHLIDSHCHLTFDFAPKTAADLVREAHLADVHHLITVGTDVETLPQVIAISEQFPEVFHTVGQHPHDAKQLTQEGIDVLERAARHPKCRAIGEIGLDYHYDSSPRETQRETFAKLLDLALRVDLPVVIHSREAEEDILSALGVYCARLPKDRIPGVIHCFTGSRLFGERCLELGFYISFSGVITFKNAAEIRECARTFPLNRILVETDAPFLAPIPHRGKRCEPAMVRATAEALAKLRNLPLLDLAQATTENAKRVFNLPA